jgi:hypothetical protein
MAFFVKMMCDAQKQQTLSSNPPFHYKTTLNKDIKLDIYADLFKKQQFMDDVYSKYKALDNPFGSVDVDPVFWANVVFTVIANHDGSQDIEIPNGCCNQNSCYINVFYQMVLNELVEQL